MGTQKNQSTSFNIDKELYQQFGLLAKEAGLSKRKLGDAVIRQFIAAYSSPEQIADWWANHGLKINLR